MIKQDKRRMSSWCAGALVLSLAITARAEAPSGRYTLSTDTVVDTKTRLTWQRSASPTTHTLEKAKDYCGAPWRLPTIKELQSLVDVRAFSPAIDTTVFPSTPSEPFWSSSLYAANTGYAWVVNFSTGYTDTDGMPGNGRVRCVR
jgi:hypothetical protein